MTFDHEVLRKSGGLQTTVVVEIGTVAVAEGCSRRTGTIFACSLERTERYPMRRSNRDACELETYKLRYLEETGCLLWEADRWSDFGQMRVLL